MAKKNAKSCTWDRVIKCTSTALGLTARRQLCREGPDGHEMGWNSTVYPCVIEAAVHKAVLAKA